MADKIPEKDEASLKSIPSTLGVEAAETNLEDKNLEAGTQTTPRSTGIEPAEKNLEEVEASTQTTQPCTGNETDPSSSRVASRNRAQNENCDHLARLLEMVGRARHNLKTMESRRLLQTEGLKDLRSRLNKENEELRQTIAAIPGCSVSTADRSTILLPNGNHFAVNTLTSSSFGPRKKESNKSVKIAEPSTQSPCLAITEDTPRASSSRSLQKKGSQQSHKRSKHRMLPSNRESMSAISERSQQSATIKELKQRFLSSFK